MFTFHFPWQAWQIKIMQLPNTSLQKFSHCRADTHVNGHDVLLEQKSNITAEHLNDPKELPYLRHYRPVVASYQSHRMNRIEVQSSFLSDN